MPLAGDDNGLGLYFLKEGDEVKSNFHQQTTKVGAQYPGGEMSPFIADPGAEIS